MHDAGAFEVRLELVAEGTTVLHVAGELDLATTDRFEAAVGDAGTAQRLVIDLSECTFLDSAAVHALARCIVAREGRATEVVAPPGIRRVLEIAALDKLVPVRLTLDDAL